MYLMHLLSGVPVRPSKLNLQGSTGFLGAISQLLTGPGCVNARVRKHSCASENVQGTCPRIAGGNCKKGQSHKIYSQTGSTTRLNLIIYFDGFFWSRVGSCAPCAPSTNELSVTKVFMGKSYRFRQCVRSRYMVLQNIKQWQWIQRQQGHFMVSSLLSTAFLQSAEVFSLRTAWFLHCSALRSIGSKM